MIQAEESITNPIYHEESDYCRLLFRGKHPSPLASSQAADVTSMASFTEIYQFAVAEEKVCAVLCAHVDIPIEEKGLIWKKNWSSIGLNLLNLRSSKEYSIARTSPFIDKLNQIWVDSLIGFGLPVDINRIHRSLIFDISSSDPVEDYLRIEPIELPLGINRIRGKFLTLLSPEILQFCSRHEILPYLAVAIDLIEKSFPSIFNLKIYPEQDPETEDEWLLLDLTLQGEVDEVLDNYDAYTDRWICSVPWPQQEKIRLSYNIL